MSELTEAKSDTENVVDKWNRFVASDTKEGITEYVRTLKGFRELCRTRRSQEGSLKQWIIFGRYHLDQFGQLSVYEDEKSSFYKRPIDVDPDIPSVVSCEVWDECHPNLGHSHRMSHTKEIIPSPDEKCDVCEEEWTIKNMWDLIRVGREDLPRHKHCARIISHESEHEVFTKIFKDAGFKHFILTAIPNGYWPDSYECMPPWFRVETLVGTVEIGWRKRVISIKLVGDEYGDIFKLERESQETTVMKNVVHAWGAEKAAEYLTRIRTRNLTVAE